MFKKNYFNKIKELPEFVKQTGGLLVLIFIIISYRKILIEEIIMIKNILCLGY